MTLSSDAHRRWGIDLDDINFERRGYDTFLAYGQAKTANVRLLALTLSDPVTTVPVTVTEVPPTSGPEVGAIEVTVGTAT